MPLCFLFLPGLFEVPWLGVSKGGSKGSSKGVGKGIQEHDEKIHPIDGSSPIRYDSIMRRCNPRGYPFCPRKSGVHRHATFGPHISKARIIYLIV